MDGRIKNQITELAKERGMRIVEKESSRFMRILAGILFFTDFPAYTTTIGNTIYMPKSKLESPRFWPTICHEIVHWEDDKDAPFLCFKLSYLFPQILALFSLVSFVAFYSTLFLFFLSFLVFLLPFPSYWRMKWEMRGYAISMHAPSWAGYSKIPPENLVSRFTDWGYYKMWPFRKNALKRLRTWHQMDTQDIVDKIPVAALMIEAVHSALNGDLPRGEDGNTNSQ